MKIKWTSINDEINTNYEVQRSADGRNWVSIHHIAASTDNRSAAYSFIDGSPEKPISYYRIKYGNQNSDLHLTEIKIVNFGFFHSVHLYPNPATSIATVRFTTVADQHIQLSLIDVTGNLLFSKTYKVNKGVNTIPLTFTNQLAAGHYTLQLISKNEIQTRPLILSR